MIARKISLISGIYLFVFVFAHLINHSFGLVSVQAMDDARLWLLAPWTNCVGGGLLLACLVVHFFLGMRSLYRRNTLRLSNFDWFQLLLGLSIPLLLLPHMATAMILPAVGGFHLTYKGILQFMWIVDPWSGLRQVLGLLAVWLHGCMGLFIWLRMQAWWGRVALMVYPTVVLLPTLALLGFVEAGKAVIADQQSQSASVSAETANAGDSYAGDSYGDYSSYGDTSDTSDTKDSGSRYGSDSYSSDYASDYSSSADSAYAGGGYGSASESDADYGSDYGNDYGDSSYSNSYGAADSGDAAAQTQQKYHYGKDIDPLLTKTVRYGLLGYLAVLLLTLCARYLRLRRHRGTAHIFFAGEPVLQSDTGVTILEVSRMNDVGHASLCGGKGRCGTCQVRVIDGASHLEEMKALERRKLQQIGAAADIRLACQARVLAGDIRLEHVLPGYVQAQDMPSPGSGGEFAGESS